MDASPRRRQTMASAKIEAVLKQIMAEADVTRDEAWSLIEPEDGLDEAEWKLARYNEAQARRAKQAEDLARAQAKRHAFCERSLERFVILD
jgi:hypothetical protein